MRYLQKTREYSKVKIDSKDKKILGILSSNARIPLTQLSRKVGLSRDAVDYRIRNYEKRGVVQGYRTMVDISKFGYKNYHLFIKLNNPSKEVEDDILGKLVKHPFIRAVIKFNGNFDFEIALVARDVEELDSVITKVVNDCSGFLQDYEILIIAKTYVAETFPPNFSGLKAGESVKAKAKIKIDKKDIEILKVMGEDANIPLIKISKNVGLSADAVVYRIRNMVNSGVILKFIPVINYVSLDYNLYTLLLNVSALDEKKERMIKSFLSSDKNTLWAVKTIGRFNVLVYLLVKNIEDLQDTIIKLRSLFPRQINNYETLIAYEEYKYVYFPAGLF